MDANSVFSNSPAILPVIHLDGSHEQALRNAETAFWAGADGVFLIGHGLRYQEVLALHEVLSTRMPKKWIGVNLLDISAVGAVSVLPWRVHGLWVDDAGVHPGRTFQAEALALARDRSRWKGELYGGVAFKTDQPYVSDNNIAAALAGVATSFVDVVTTSGPATGVPPTIEKIQAMKDVLAGRALLGCASGLTPENVKQFRGMFDRILVATGVSLPDDFHNLNSELLRRFIGEARE